jgi:hypothetical protein
MSPVNRRQFMLDAGRVAGGAIAGTLAAGAAAEAGRARPQAQDSENARVERPANAVRSVMRLFVSEVEDKPWFYDRAFWERYLAMLAGEQFNRFHLAFGIGYDFLREVSDAYLHFAYPFLLAVPGYPVTAKGLPDAERDRNLAALRFISNAAAAHGLHFQLGLWTHGYDWAGNPRVNYTIEGLNAENHAPYCRDALRALVQACPAIQGVTFRIHGESGIPEATYPFWKTVLEGIVRCGRRVEIDMHAKGIDAEMIEIGLATGMPVTVSPKFWAEHMGLPYQPASIRALEQPPREAHDEGFFSRSSGSRRFLRYSFGDLFAEDRKYGVLFRIWPGTQRLLLWGDPVMAAAYGRAAGFCGAAGLELMEPLSFKGRKGSGRARGRDAYADTSLRSHGADWEKYRVSYRLWGRHLNHPEPDPEAGRRLLQADLGEAAAPAAEALARASRILPLVTTAHCPSAANNNYWPEIYTNMPVVDAKRPHPYGDTPSPKIFATVSPLDPELFSTIEEFVAGLLDDQASVKYSPLEVALWLDRLAAEADRHLARARQQAADSKMPAFRRLEVDVALQCGLGRFFAGKLRAGVLYALYERTGDSQAIAAALKEYRAARAAWADLTARADGVYVSDITFGAVPHLRGHWKDRLAAIDADLEDMEKRAAAKATSPGGAAREQADRALQRALARPARPTPALRHRAPAGFRRGEAVRIEAEAEGKGARPLPVVRLHYRRVNQHEPYQVIEMAWDGERCRGVIPGDYTASPYPLQYYFELRNAQGGAALDPGVGDDLCRTPYYVLRQAR